MSAPSPVPGERFRVRWLGRMPYEEAWDLQRAFWEGRVDGRSRDDYLLLVEHPPTYTIGRNGDGSHLRVDEAALPDLGFELHNVDRGGDITYHGPGQLVGYPIVAVPRFGNGYDMVGHVRRIEEMLIAALADLGVSAHAEVGYTGVWTGTGKVAAIGVRVVRGVATHGFALNLEPDLSHFDNIVPCGISDRPVTSVSQILGHRVSLEEAVEALLPHASRIFEVDELVASGVFTPNRSGEVPVSIRGVMPGEPARPEWMRVKADLRTEGFRDLKRLMRGLELNTVCEEAGCPNIYECWESGTSTLMLLGDTCTRACSFCDVATGRPGAVDRDEPARAATAVEQMRLRHAVLTSVNRDDLPDGGAGVFAETIHQIRDRVPDCDVEILIPDFKGDRDALETVMVAKPEVLNHNTETVLRLQREIRTAANYGRSLALLARARWMNPMGTVKSGLIVGMGETETEVSGTLADLGAVGVDIVTIGQYLRPTARHRPIHRYVEPAEFDRYRDYGERCGIAHVEAGPLVRSSYHARDSLAAAAP